MRGRSAALIRISIQRFLLTAMPERSAVPIRIFIRRFRPRRPTKLLRGKPGGGGGGRGGPGGGKRKLLGDQTRIEAYDPDLDKADRRNIGVIDTKGNVNQQVYAASPMAHPEAYPKGTDQFTPGGQTSQTIDQRDKPATTGAIQGALNWIGDQFHQDKPDQHTNEGYVALTKGAAGAPDDDTMRSVFAVVDPKIELDYKHRMELATKTGYDYYNHIGQPEKAKKFAAEALQYGNKQAQSYGDQAMKDMQNGNRGARLPISRLAMVGCLMATTPIPHRTARRWRSTTVKARRFRRSRSTITRSRTWRPAWRQARCFTM